MFALTQRALHILSSLPAEFYYLTSKTRTPGTFQTLKAEKITPSLCTLALGTKFSCICRHVVGRLVVCILRVMLVPGHLGAGLTSLSTLLFLLPPSLVQRQTLWDGLFHGPEVSGPSSPLSSALPPKPPPNT